VAFGDFRLALEDVLQHHVVVQHPVLEMVLDVMAFGLVVP
jgi:hypothetical protein